MIEDIELYTYILILAKVAVPMPVVSKSWQKPGFYISLKKTKKRKILLTLINGWKSKYLFLSLHIWCDVSKKNV